MEKSKQGVHIPILHHGFSVLKSGFYITEFWIAKILFSEYLQSKHRACCLQNQQSSHSNTLF